MFLIQIYEKSFYYRLDNPDPFRMPFFRLLRELYLFVCGRVGLHQSDTVVQGNSYSDSLITMKWDLVGARFRFDFANETDENIEIDWRKVSLMKHF